MFVQPRTGFFFFGRAFHFRFRVGLRSLVGLGDGFDVRCRVEFGVGGCGGLGVSGVAVAAPLQLRLGFLFGSWAGFFLEAVVVVALLVVDAG